MAQAREAALTVLLRLEQGGAYSNLLLDSVLEQSSLSRRDAALATALVYGVAARRLSLDYYITQFARREAAGIQPTLREIMRVALYQLLYMDRIPARAAVNEAVQSAKKHHLGHASGFVNGVLRAAARAQEAGTLPMPDARREPLRWLSVHHSFPEPLIRFWYAAYGEAYTHEIMEQMNRPPVLALRVNTLRTTADALEQTLQKEGMETRRAQKAPDALLVSGGAGVRGLLQFAQGLFFVQGLSSQTACLALDPQPGETVMDVCAAPGGKSFSLALLMRGQGLVRAFDIHPQRVALIRQGAVRLGLQEIVQAEENDASRPNPALGEADRVLCDVPCSGLGVIRGKPEIRYKNLKTFDALPDLQYSILCEGASHLREKGTLVYSTCTLNPAENEMVVARFLQAHPFFAPAPFDGAPDGSVTFFPSADGVDGFFIARLRRQ